MKRWAATLLHPSPEPPCAVGQILSRLDAYSDRAGIDLVERLFRTSSGIPKIAAALTRFLGDPEAERVLKKAMHSRLEHRMRSWALRLDPPTAYGFGALEIVRDIDPLDPVVIAALEDASGERLPRPAVPWTVRCRHWVSVGVWCVAVCVRGLGLFRCVVNRRGQFHQRAEFVMHAGMDGVHRYMTNALRRTGSWTPDSLLTIDVGDGFQVGEPGAATVKLKELPVAPSVFFGWALPGAIRLCATVLATVLRHGRNAEVVGAAIDALRMAASTLHLLPIATGLRFRYYLDTAEHNPYHALKAILFRRFGTGRILRMPHSQMDTWGTGLSYLGYDVFLSGGPYLRDTFSRTWTPRCHHVNVGMFQHDSCFRENNMVAAKYRQMIEAEHARGRAIIVLFGPSAVEMLQPLVQKVFSVLSSILRDREDCLLVIKPKGWGSDRLMRRYLLNGTSLNDQFPNGNAIWIEYSRFEGEICPSGWLMRHMSLGTGIGGSVPIESLSIGQPYILYYPTPPLTPLVDELKKAGLFHTEIESYGKALVDCLDGRLLGREVVASMQRQFDPYQDDLALTRMIGFMFPEVARTVAESRATSNLCR